MSKESYLEKYDDFVTDVSENYKSYSEKDWKKATQKHENFSGKWYETFENEFSLKDQIKIKANQTKWYYYRNLADITSTIRQLFESLDVKGMKKQVQYYIDNNMQSDLQKFYEEAQKAGKAAEETVAEIFEELKINIEDLQQ
jgi:type II secretory pathway component GspD/PulD (secretin)